MNRVYIFAVILFVVIVGGTWVVTSTRSGKQPGPEAPTPEISQPVAATVSAVPTQLTTTMKPTQYSGPPPVTIDTKKSYAATVVTDKGAMTIKLFASESPVTVNNFVFLSREGFYNNTIFHRVIKGFMIQGGDPRGTGTGGPGYTFADEKITRDYTRGTIAMANSGPNTNGSQFFIMHADYPLPKNYVIFGTIDSSDSTSLATLDAIAGAAVTDNGTGEVSKPVSPTVLQSIHIKEE